MTDTHAARPASIRWWRWGGADLALPDPEARASRQGFGLPRSAPVLMVLLALGATAVLPAPWAVTTPARLVDVANAVRVHVGDTDPALHGRIVVPAVDPHPSLLMVAAGLVRPDRRLTGAPAERVRGLDPVESALLVGQGIAPGRGQADRLGLSADVGSDDTTRTQLGVLLAVVDLVNSADLVAGRTVLALGSVDADGTVGCPAGAEASLEAAGAADVPMAAPLAPDLVIVPAACAVEDVAVRTLVGEAATVLAVGTLEEAVAGLQRAP